MGCLGDLHSRRLAGKPFPLFPVLSPTDAGGPVGGEQEPSRAFLLLALLPSTFISFNHNVDSFIQQVFIAHLSALGQKLFSS